MSNALTKIKSPRSMEPNTCATEERVPCSLCHLAIGRGRKSLSKGESAGATWVWGIGSVS